jgi:hypothetical protein
MIARLGYVLYWIACGAAGLLLLGVIAGLGILVTGYSTDPSSTLAGMALCAVVAGLCWGVGKAFRYILAGT